MWNSYQTRQAAYEQTPPVESVPVEIGPNDWRVLVGAQPDGNLARDWRYTCEKPADGWNVPEFDDQTWSVGRGGFGAGRPAWKQYKGTAWTTDEIWLRQTFDCDDTSFQLAVLVVLNVDNAQVYLNGKRIWGSNCWNDPFEGFDVTKAVAESLRMGQNTLAVHCHRDASQRAQYIDVALLLGERKGKAGN